MVDFPLMNNLEKELPSKEFLQEKLGKIDLALGRLNETRNSIGTATFDKGVGRHLDLSTLTGEERLDAAIRTGDIRRRIEES